MAYVYATTEQCGDRVGVKDLARQPKVAAIRDLSEAILADYLDEATSPVPAAVVLEAHLRIFASEWAKSTSIAGNPPNALGDTGQGVTSPIYYSRDPLTPVRELLQSWVPIIGFGAASDGVVRDAAW